MNWTPFLSWTEEEHTAWLENMKTVKAHDSPPSVPTAGGEDTDTKGVGRGALFTKASPQSYEIVIANFKMKSPRLRKVKGSKHKWLALLCPFQTTGSGNTGAEVDAISTDPSTASSSHLVLASIRSILSLLHKLQTQGV